MEQKIISRGFEVVRNDMRKFPHNKIKLPTRSTSKAMAYDFYANDTYTIEPNEIAKVWTDVKEAIYSANVMYGLKNDGSIVTAHTYTYMSGSYYDNLSEKIKLSGQKLIPAVEIGKIVDITSKYVETNMNFSILKDYIPYAINMDTNNIKAEQLPGQAEYINGISFFLADEEETKIMIDELFRGIVHQETTEEQ